MLCSQTKYCGTATAPGGGWATLTNIVSSNDARVTYQWPNGTGSTNAVQDETVKVMKADGSYGSTNKAQTGVGTNWPNGTDGTAGYGGATDVWGETWTPADINDTDFGIVLRAKETGFNVTSPYLECDNFGFTIPTGATIVGIQAYIERQYTEVTTRANTLIAHVDTIYIIVWYTTQYPQVMLF